MVSFADQLKRNTQRFLNDFEKAQRQAIRKGLQEGVKEYKKIAKSFIPVLGKSTPQRQKGTVKNNLRHRIKVKKKGDDFEGIGTLQIRRAGGKKMAPVSANTKDKTDPFYWFMLDRGTDKMEGLHFMKKAKAAGEAKAQRKTNETILKLMRENMRRWR